MNVLKFNSCLFNLDENFNSTSYFINHAQIADDNDKFVAIYNAGISSRLLGEYQRASNEFEEALSIATPR